MQDTCLLCKGTKVKRLLYEMRQCRDCQFFFLDPAERAKQQASFHLISDQEVNQEHLALLKKKYPKDNHRKRLLYARYADRLIPEYGTGIKALDVGASGGFFLRELELRGASVANLRTLEVDPAFLALAKEYFGYQGDIGSIESYISAVKFDVVVLFDVLEHVDNFWQALETIHTLLAPGGRLILKLPNARWSYLKYRGAQLLGRPQKIPTYLYLEPGGHLNYWNYQSIKKLAQAGFGLESFEYAKPSKQQFGAQYWIRMLGYRLNELCKLNLFPEFIVTFKKVEK